MKRHKELFGLIRNLVNNWDPCGFIVGGSPEDEYDAITFKLMSGIVNKQNTLVIKEDVLKLLDEYYGGPSTFELSTENQIKLVKNIEHIIDEIKNNTSMQ